MAAKWCETTLGNVIELKRGYDLPQQNRRPGTVPLVSSSGVTDHHAEAMVKGPGVVTGRYGTLGQVFYVPEDFWPLNTTLYVRDFKGNDPRFISYFLRSLDFLAFSDKAAVPGLNRNHLHQARVRLPSDVDEQRAIAHVLGTFDDKIELNRRIKESLEALAQTIFKSWFVEFGPVRSKASGESQESICRRLGLAADLLALFPDHFSKSELGEIPAQWTVTSLKNLTKKIGSGATPKGGREVYVDEGTALIRSQNVYDSEFVWDGLARISDEAADQLNNVEVLRDDVLINITGASILRSCVVDPYVLPARVNQHVAIIRPNAGIPPRFLHLHLLEQTTRAYLLGMNAGASREAITKGHLESVPVILPPLELLSQFQSIVAPIYAQCEQASSQSRVLAAMRDAMFPKLLSGELSVPVPGDA